MALEKVVLHATSLRIPVVEVEGGTLTSLAGFDGHQGVALVVGPRRWATIDSVLERARERGEPPFLLVLDSLEDPQNVGTLLRSAEAAGVHGVIFPTHRQAPLSPAAVKASSGAVEHLLLVPVDDLGGALADLHVKGLRIAGSDGDAPLSARQADLRGPLALVVGSEGQGIGPAVRRRADFLVRIPMRGKIGALNAAVAGSVLLFEALAQRDAGGESAPDPEAHSALRSGPEDQRPETDAATFGADDATEQPAPKRVRRARSARATEAEAAIGADGAADLPSPDTSADELPAPAPDVSPAPVRLRRVRKAAAAPEPVVEDQPAGIAEAEQALAAAPEPVRLRRTRKAPAAVTSAAEVGEAAAPAPEPRRPARSPRSRTAEPAAAPAADDPADDLLPGGPVG